jgi:hypothetical protein
MSNTFIQEAFKQFYLTEDAEEFSLNVSGPDDVESFLDIVAPEEDEEVISDVYDLEAEAKEDLKQSYLGKVILDCNVCHSNVFFNKDEITENEDGLCCVEIECPYCMSNEGYTIIGEVKPYQEEGDVDIEDIETEEVPEEPVEDVEIDVEETEEEPVEEELEEGLKADEVKELRGNEEINGADGPIAAVDELEGSDEIRGPKYTELKEAFDETQNKFLDILYGQDDYDAEEACEFLLGFANDGVADGYYELLDENGFDDSAIYWLLDNMSDEEVNAAIKVFKENAALGEKLDECGGGDAELVEGIENGELIPGAIFTNVDEEDEKYKYIGETDGFYEFEPLTDSAKREAKAINYRLEYDDGLYLPENTVDTSASMTVEDVFSYFYAAPTEWEDEEELEESLTEGIEDVSINTEDENITMTTKEDGGVVVETSPKEDAVVEDEVIDDAEMIAPLEPETEADIEAAVDMNDEEGEEVLDDDEFADFEEFDEESFDNLGESYLKRCYENVTSFKTSNITLNENKEFIIEGKIGFDSGNEKNTQFIFSKKSDENGKLKLEGYNRQISAGKKTFKLNCSINDKSLVCESLNYNYKGKNDLNESVRVYGTVKRK